MADTQARLKELLGELHELMERAADEGVLGEKALMELGRQKLQEISGEHQGDPARAQMVEDTLTGVLQTISEGIIQIKRASIEAAREIGK